MEFFRTYSPAFRNTLEGIFSTHPFWEVDVQLLWEKGQEAIRNRAYTEGTHYLEAALQLEIQPYFRHQLLNLLAVCYLRSGDTDSARTVQRQLQEKKMIHLYDILPERGF